MRPLPDSALEIIEDLEENYPPRCKSPDESLEEHARYAGQVALIEALRYRYEWTQENARAGDLLKG